MDADDEDCSLSCRGSTEETNMTYKEYDMTELMKLLKSFGLVSFC